MGWVSEQNVGVGDSTFRGVWFKGNLFMFVQERVVGVGACGVWHRDGVGPWTQTRSGNHPAYWEADGAFYCGGNSWIPAERPKVYRSADGINWVLDWTVPGGWVATPGGIYGMEAYDDYLYCFINDVGVDATILRRDRTGTWTDLPTGLPPELTPNTTRGVIEFGGTRYWTDSGFVRYWDGAAWVPEPTLDGACGYCSWMSVIDNVLYVGASATLSPPYGGYYWKTPSVTNWSFLSHEVPDNTWGNYPLCVGADGEVYTWSTVTGADIRVYRKINNHLSLIHQDTAGLAGMLGLYGGVGINAAGEMYLGEQSAGNVHFFAFAPTYDLTPGGLYPQAMDCDGDGDMLYLGLYDTATAQPILISVALPLDGAASMGSNIFSPGAGTSINIRCNSVGDNLAISGHFGANEQVETSDDGGITWTDIDPGTWGAALAQPLVVDPLTLDEVMIALTPQSIIETLDGGTTWTVHNAAVGFSPGAMVKLVNGTEMIIGDDAANVILYSPNRGVSTANVTGAFGGNVAALEIT